MPTQLAQIQHNATGATPEIEALLAPLTTLPEPEALKHYARLSPRLQWIARQRTTGQRRASLIVHHVILSAQCR
jgi:hypothetical protein